MKYNKRHKINILLIVILVFISGVSSAQNTEAPDALAELAKDVKLGVQVRGGVKQRYQDVLPLMNRSYEYLKRPVQGKLSHTTPYYGIGVSLRARGVEVAATYWQGDGVQSSSYSFQFQNDTRAFPYQIRFYSGLEVQVEYFVLDWIGVGVGYRASAYEINSEQNFRLNGKQITPRINLFTGNMKRNRYALYVPIRREWGLVDLFGRVGGALGDGSDRYYTDFVLFQSPENPSFEIVEPEKRPQTMFKEGSAKMNEQFVRVGVEVPVWGTTVRPSVGARRLHVPDRTTSWSYDVQLEVGLPF